MRKTAVKGFNRHHLVMFGLLMIPLSFNTIYHSRRKCKCAQNHEWWWFFCCCYRCVYNQTVISCMPRTFDLAKTKNQKSNSPKENKIYNLFWLEGNLLFQMRILPIQPRVFSRKMRKRGKSRSWSKPFNRCDSHIIFICIAQFFKMAPKIVVYVSTTKPQ